MYRIKNMKHAIPGSPPHIEHPGETRTATNAFNARPVTLHHVIVDRSPRRCAGTERHRATFHGPSIGKPDAWESVGRHRFACNLQPCRAPIASPSGNERPCSAHPRRIDRPDAHALDLRAACIEWAGRNLAAPIADAHRQRRCEPLARHASGAAYPHAKRFRAMQGARYNAASHAGIPRQLPRNGHVVFGVTAPIYPFRGSRGS